MKKGLELAQILNAHYAMCIPSVWEEPFGIVALEGSACGCRVICSDNGGLPEAAGPGAFLFRTGDANNLAETIKSIFENPKEFDHPTQDEIEKHLQSHKRATIGALYMEFINDRLARNI